MSHEHDLHFAEYAKPVANKGKIRLARVLLILGYVSFAVIYCLVFTAAIPLPQVIALLPLFLWMAVFFTWRHVSYECAVRVCEGKLVLLKLNGKKERICQSVSVKDLIEIRPFAEPYTALLQAEAIPLLRDHRADPDSACAYYAVFLKDQKKCAVVFDSADNASNY